MLLINGKKWRAGDEMVKCKSGFFSPLAEKTEEETERAEKKQWGVHC